MGSVADKIAKKIISSGRSKVVNLAGWQEGRKMALEAGLGDDGLTRHVSAGIDPCHAIYTMGQNVTSHMAESISEMREAKGYTVPIRLTHTPTTCSVAVIENSGTSDLEGIVEFECRIIHK